MTTAAAGAAYRADIDGLRAVSVVAVVLFHAGVPGVPGGFVGVDVFFVISGYLITGLLAAEYARTGRISLSSFWARRVRRLAPALLFVLAAVVVMAMIGLQRISGEVGSASRAAIATLLLNANHFFLREAGDYFGAAAETNPLLHMWSLSVEEQFYFVWPLLLFFLLGSRRRVWLAIPLLVVCSAALACYWTYTSTAAAFYLMPARAWELLLGGALALTPPAAYSRLSTRASSLIAAGGAALVIGSTLAIGGRSGFPGPLAALPVAGALLLIMAGAVNPTNRVSRVLAGRVLVYLGKISYPLYLWHWPLLVVLRSQRLFEPELVPDALAVLAAVPLAAFTYEVIERGAWSRVKGWRAARTIASGAVGTAAVLALAVALGAWARYGWGYTEKEKALDAARRDLPALDCMFRDKHPSTQQIDACYPPSRKPSVLLWGDSHANHWRPAFEAAGERLGLDVGVITMNACRPVPGPVGPQPCVDLNNTVLASLERWKRERGLKGIVVSARWADGTGTLIPSIAHRARADANDFYDARAHTQAEALAYFESALQTLAVKAADAGIRVLVILPSPIQRFAGVHCLALRPTDACYISNVEMSAYASPAEEVIKKVASANRNVHTLDPKTFMCSGGRCPVVFDGLIGYTDDNHVTRAYAQRSADRFAAELRWIADIPGSSGGPAQPEEERATGVKINRHSSATVSGALR